MRMLTQQSKLLYESLGHEGFYTVVRCIDVNKGEPVGKKIVNNLSDFLKAANEFNGLGNVFYTRNSFKKAEDQTIKEGDRWVFDGVKYQLNAVHNLTLDLDPENYDKTIGSTKDQMEACERAGRAILENYPGGWLAFSGNGCLVSLPFELDWMENLLTFPALFKAWSEKYIQPIVAKTEGVKLDGLYDNERLCKLVGTVSCRGERRFTKFLVLPSGRTHITRLQDEFRGLAESLPLATDSGNGTEGGSVSNLDLNASRSFTKIGHPNRQKYLLSLAGALHRRGLSESLIFETIKKAYQNNCVLEPIKTDKKLMEIVTAVMKYPNGEGLKNYGALLVDDNIEQEVSLERDIESYESQLDERGKLKEPELPTGFKNLDDLCNGYQRGDIFTLGAYTGGGKTTLLVNSADHLCKVGRKVLYLPTEMSKASIFNKFYSLNTGTNYKVYEKGNFSDEELQKRKEFSKRFKEYNLIVDDSLTLTEESVKLLVMKHRPDVLMFDHIHEVGNGSINYYGFLKDFTHALQLIARDFNCAVVLAAQFQRPPRLLDASTGQYKKPPKPTTQSIKSCGDIENKSRVVALLSDTFTSLYPERNTMELDIAKCTKGSKGIIRLSWRWEKSKFEEM